jgi:hypothetical protein
MDGRKNTLSNPIVEKFLSYRDKFGLIQIQPNQTSQNGLLWTGESIVVMKDNGVLDAETEEMLFQAMNSCLVEPGLLRRSPTNMGDLEAHDDNIGYTTAAWLCGRTHLAEDVLQHGLLPIKLGPFTFNFVYNNLIPRTFLKKATPEQRAARPWYERILNNLFCEEGYRFNLSAWRGRMPQFVAHLYWATNRKPPLFYRIAQALVIWDNSKLKDGGHPDTWMLTWLMIRTINGRCWMANWASKRFYLNMARIFGTEGLKHLHYIGGGHPINTYWVK